MNSVHASKNWQNLPQAPLQSPTSNAVVEPTSSPTPSTQAAGYSPTMLSNRNYSTTETIPNTIKEEEDASKRPFIKQDDTASTGLVAHSQPNTPRPENNRESQSNVETPGYQEAPPFPFRNVGKGRSPLFAHDSSPYFSATEVYNNLYSSDKSTPLALRISSKMDRGFFSNDNDWTCYRRNYFQISNVFTVQGFNQYYPTSDPNQCVPFYVQCEGNLVPVQRFLLGVTARVANSDKEIELVQHTPKRDKGPQYKPEPKPITPGGNLSMSSVVNNQSVVTFERVQFKTATANNGKRRAAQQYYVCVVELYAETERRQLVKIGTTQSAPLVVRGRSPGHYADMQERAVPVAHHHTYSQRPQVYIPGAPQNNQPIMSMPNGYSGQATPNTGTYAYYNPTSYPQQHQYATPNNVQTHSNVSSPASHHPLPSPYAQNNQIPMYGIHDNGHSEPYPSEYHPQQQNEEPKMAAHHQFHMQQTGPIESPHSGYDWHRARYNSSSSGSSSAPSPGQQHDGQTTYFVPNETHTRPPYSPTASNSVTSGRKYSTVPNLVNKQQIA